MLRARHGLVSARFRPRASWGQASAGAYRCRFRVLQTVQCQASRHIRGQPGQRRGPTWKSMHAMCQCASLGSPLPPQRARGRCHQANRADRLSWPPIVAQAPSVALPEPQARWRHLRPRRQRQRLDQQVPFPAHSRFRWRWFHRGQIPSRGLRQASAPQGQTVCLHPSGQASLRRARLRQRRAPSQWQGRLLRHKMPHRPSAPKARAAVPALCLRGQ